jgi:hypothetical protein
MDADLREMRDRVSSLGFWVDYFVFCQRTYKEDVRLVRGSNVLSRTETRKRQRYTKETKRSEEND